MLCILLFLIIIFIMNDFKNAYIKWVSKGKRGGLYDGSK
ncbi:Hypothetical protein bcf_02410 [Bacillus cereus F837/76]|uniref:Uncharacterized protein n=1 Tax=Bacillus cereus (strain 03BB102) TaxID=572264 RepID=A0A158RMK8_BACC3|nr:hypothetical protein BCA_0512 [Bacillus cereus 03BB102]AEW53647.1 Hypothetical protein bcf_02410 [Bacillus cereus F837/76]EDX62618.1 hypothetical protein BC03BB108_0420 [Bacillus cereus 03BB108]EDX67580.1 hypothetical protein BC059799_0413 [Bacillus cereus NVH0597-99]